MHAGVASSSSRGQSALEYLFLLAGGVIIVIIILLSVIGLTPLGENFLGTNIQEYEKIDLCTGHTADCAMGSDWVAGLLSIPPGIQLQSSTWRDLYIDQIGIELQCFKNGAFSPCLGEDFFLPIQIGFNLPISPASCTDVSSTPGTPIYDCAYCDPALGSCANTPLFPMCPNGLQGACTIPLTSLTPLGWGIHLPPSTQPNASQEMVFGIAGEILGKGHSKRGKFSFHVQQIKKDDPTCTSGCAYSIKPGTSGTHVSALLNYFVSWKSYTGSFQVCRNQNLSPPSPNHSFYGCTVPLGGNVDVGLCNYDTTLPYPGASLAEVFDYYGTPANQNADLGNNEGEVIQLDVTPLAISPVLPPFPPRISLELANFGTMPDPSNGNNPCWQHTGQTPVQNLAAAQSNCATFCTSKAGTLTANNLGTGNLEFFRINPTLSSSQWCDALANPIPSNATPISVINTLSPSASVYSDGVGNPTGADCGVHFLIPTLSGTTSPSKFYVGFKRKNASAVVLPEVYSTLRSHSALGGNTYERGLILSAFSIQ